MSIRLCGLEVISTTVWCKALEGNGIAISGQEPTRCLETVSKVDRAFAAASETLGETQVMKRSDWCWRTSEPVTEYGGRGHCWSLTKAPLEPSWAAQEAYHQAEKLVSCHVKKVTGRSGSRQYRWLQTFPAWMLGGQAAANDIALLIFLGATLPKTVFWTKNSEEVHSWGWRHGSVRKVLSTQTWGPEFNP